MIIDPDDSVDEPSTFEPQYATSPWENFDQVSIGKKEALNYKKRVDCSDTCVESLDNNSKDIKTQNNNISDDKPSQLSEDKVRIYFLYVKIAIFFCFL